ncbi:hypothetical protein NDU88_002254 [Pleurodeles waltl]|uniref:Uncharacterized protein n=1 Tax=Pleurodeles waltl TaxID=8319 RepID=A0AAV7LBU7_PLEWA|nr:hypothetical protein NDU88_002254 [Pleurodeles waltl]
MASKKRYSQSAEHYGEQYAERRAKALLTSYVRRQSTGWLAAEQGAGEECEQGREPAGKQIVWHIARRPYRNTSVLQSLLLGHCACLPAQTFFLKLPLLPKILRGGLGRSLAGTALRGRGQYSGELSNDIDLVSLRMVGGGLRARAAFCFLRTAHLVLSHADSLQCRGIDVFPFSSHTALGGEKFVTKSSERPNPPVYFKDTDLTIYRSRVDLQALKVSLIGKDRQVLLRETRHAPNLLATSALEV